MRWVMVMLLAAASTACASGPSLQQATSLHNTYKHLVQDADGFVAPLFDNAERVIASTYRNDDAAYARAMEPFNQALNALGVAKRGEQLLQLAISQWQAGLDDGGMVKEVAACGAQSVGALAPQLASLPGGAVWYGAVGFLADQLERLADGRPCATPEKIAEVLK